MINEEEPTELEDWMRTWQTTPEERLTSLRENFSKKQLWLFITDFGSALAFAVAILVLTLKAITAPGLFTVAVAFIFCPYFAISGWRVVRRVQTRRRALPLSGREYVSAMKHNLEIEQRELRWEQKTLPVVVLFGSAVFVWILVDGWTDTSVSTLAFLLVVALGGFGFALWSAFFDKPENLRREMAGLDEVASELSSGGTD